MANESAMQTLGLDPPVQLVATYRMDLADRQYLDQQVRFTQKALHETALVGYDAHWSWIDPAAETVQPGDALCVSSTGDHETAYLRRATTSALSDAGTVLGVAVTEAGPGGRVLVATAGHLPRKITGLTVIGYVTYVRVTAAGRLEQTTTPTGETIVGRAEPNGRMTIALGSEALGGSLAVTNDWKESARFAITSALPAYTRTGNTIEANANGAIPTQDGVPPAVNDRALLAVGTSVDNGIWVFTALGSGGSKWGMARASDADSSGDVTVGLRIGVTSGTNNKGVWQLITADPITLNTTPLTFQKDQGIAPGTANGQVAIWNGTTWTAGAVDLADPDAVVPGGANQVYWSNGTTNSWTGSPTVTNLTVTALLTAGALAFGADPADAGAIRLSHAMGIYGESSTPGTDRAVLTWGVVAADTVGLGDANVVARVTGSAVHAYVGGTQVASLGIAAGDMIRFGALPSASGAIRVAIGMGIFSRNNGNTADFALIQSGADDSVYVGSTANNANVYLRSGSGYSTIMSAGGTTFASVSASGMLLTLTPVQFTAGVAGPALNQAAKGDDTAPQNLTLGPQSPWASATGANRTPGSLVAALAAPTNSGTTEAGFKVTRGGSLQCQIGAYNTPPTYTAVWLGPGIVPSLTNFAFLGDGTGNAYLNAPSGGTVYISTAGTSVNGINVSATTVNFASPALVQWGQGVSSPQLRQDARTTDVAASVMTISAQSAWSGATVNMNGGTLVLQGGTRATAGGTDGAIHFYSGATRVCYMSQNATYRQLTWETDTTPVGILARRSDSAMMFSAQGGMIFYYGATNYAVLTTTDWTTTIPNLRFDKDAGAITIKQDSRTTDALPQALKLSAQYPYASATGANRQPGLLILDFGAPTNSGTAESGVAITRSGSRHCQIGPYNSPPTLTSVWLGPGISPTTTNFALACDGTSITYLNVPSGGTIYLSTNGTGSNGMSVTSGVVQLNSPTVLRFAKGVAAPEIGQEAPTTDAAAQALVVSAQRAYASASTNLDGGILLLRGGAEKGSAAGKKGGVRIQLNGTTETMIEAVEVAIGRRVIVFGRGSDITTTQMPSGTGDGVVYLANAATARSTGVPVGGGILEAGGGHAYWTDEAGITSQLD